MLQVSCGARVRTEWAPQACTGVLEAVTVRAGHPPPRSGGAQMRRGAGGRRRSPRALRTQASECG